MGRGPAIRERPCGHCGKPWKPRRRHDHGGKPVRFCSPECRWNHAGAWTRETKTCSKRGEEKPVDGFQRDKTVSGGHKSQCRECKKEYQLEYDLRRHYGISKAEYGRIYTEQDGRCAICGEKCMSGRRLSVDHDHDTGAVRALLCGNCNKGLGCFQDNAELLLSASRYLEDHGSRSSEAAA